MPSSSRQMSSALNVKHTLRRHEAVLHLATRRATMSLPPPVSNQVVVYRIMPDPDPRNLAILDVAQSSVTSADSNRPDSSADRLEVERRMTRVITPQSVVFARQFANSFRQLLVALPESRGAGRIHGKGRSVPDLRAARASSMRKSRRPLCASRAILSSQTRSRWSSNHLPSLKNSSAGRCSIAFSISCTVLMVGMLSRRCLSRNSVFSLTAECASRSAAKTGRLTRPTDTEAW